MDAGSKLLLVAACLLAVAVLTSDGRPAKQLIRLKRTSADREKKIEQNDLTPVRREVDGVEARISTRQAAEAALPDRIDAAFRKLLRVKRQDELELTGEDDGSKEGQDDDESGKNDDPDDDQNDEDDYDDDDDDDNNDENENNNDGDDDEEDDNNDDDEDNDDDDDEDDDGDDGDYDDEDDDDDDDDDTDEDDFAAHFEAEIDSLLDSTDSGVGANDENLLTDPLEDDDEDDDDEDDLIEDEKDKQFDFWDYIMNMFNFGPDWQQQVEEEFDDGFYDGEEDDDGYLLGEDFDPDGHGYSLSEADVDDNEDQLAKVSMEVVGEGKTEKTGDRLKRSIK